MKKIGAILSSTVIMIALLLPMNASALSGSGRLSGPSTVKVNDTFNVSFSVSADSDFYGIQGNIDYNSSQLQLVSVSGVKGNWTVNNNGRVITADDNTLNTHTKGSNTFFNVKFKVKSYAKAGQKISVKYNYFITDGSTKSSSSATYSSTVVASSTNKSNTTKRSNTTKKSSKLTTQAVTDVTDNSDTTTNKNNNVKLNSMTVEGFTLSPKFNPDQKEYIVWLPYETENINISALPVNEKSTVKVEGGKKLKAGKANIIKVTCLAEDGKKQVYTIKAMRAPLSGVYATETSTKPSNNTKSGTPLWLTIVLCVACALVGFIFALIISSIKKKRDLGPYDDGDDMLGLDLFDHDDDIDRNEKKPKGSSNFEGIKFPESKKDLNKVNNSNKIENEQNKRMYIKPNMNNTFNDNVQSSKIGENTITVDSKPPVIPQAPKPVKPPMQQRPVQQQVPTQPTAQRPVQQQVPTQPTAQRPVQQQVPTQPTVQRPVQQQIPTQPTAQRPVQQQVPTQPTAQRPMQQQKPIQQPTVQRPVQPPVQRPVQQQNPVKPPVQRSVQQQVPTQPTTQRPAQPFIEKPVQPQVKQTQPKIEKPVQPKTEIKSGASIEVGDKMNKVKPTSSAPNKNSNVVPKEVEKMRLPYTAAGSPQPEQQLDKPVAPKPTKKLPRNPFELSADD